jgi:hypothetical protein
MPKRKFPRARAPWALDSGGFTWVTRDGGWKQSPRLFAAEVRRFRDEIGLMEWAAPQDWMCEEIALKATGLSVAEHARRTVDNYVELVSIAPDLPWIPVLQGFAVDDYRRCADRYLAAGVDLAQMSTVGLGTVCRRQGTKEGIDVVFSVARHVPGVRLHGFGFKVEGVDLARTALVSSDSLAWSRRGRYVTKPDHEHPRKAVNCANCLTFALRWREDLLSRKPRPVQVPLF